MDSTFGWVGDRIQSRQTPFVLGLVVLGGATLSFALGSSLPVLLIARVLQGMSTAIVFTVGFALLFDVIGKEKIGQAMGYTSMSLSFGLFLGPVVGGIIYQYGGYFQVFIPAFVLIALEILLRFVVIEQRTPSNPVRSNPPDRALETPPERVSSKPTRTVPCTAPLTLGCRRMNGSSRREVLR